MKEIHHQEQPEKNTLSREYSSVRRWARNALLAGCLAAGSLFYQSDVAQPDELLMAHPDSVPFNEDVITVMTANVHSWDGPDGDNFNRFKAVMNQEGVDLACVQEATDEDSNFRELFTSGYNVYFGKTIHWPWRERFGNLIISKAPLVSAESMSLPNRHKITSPRNALMAEVRTTEGNLSVLATHFSTSSRERRDQAHVISPILNNQEGIFCGDLNQPRETLAAGPLAGFSSSIHSATRINTYPSGKEYEANREIDYIVPVCGQIVVGSERQVEIKSDHKARIADIDISDCF